MGEGILGTHNQCTHEYMCLQTQFKRLCTSRTLQQDYVRELEGGPCMSLVIQHQHSNKHTPAS